MSSPRLAMSALNWAKLRSSIAGTIDSSGCGRSRSGGHTPVSSGSVAGSAGAVLRGEGRDADQRLLGCFVKAPRKGELNEFL
jgi:hypothetical protein